MLYYRRNHILIEFRKKVSASDLADIKSRRERMHNPKPNEIYQHFKGNLYKIITPAIHTETGEEMVVYQALYGDYGVYVRPLSMFQSLVDREKYPDTAQKYRFELVSQIIGQDTAAAQTAQKAAGTQADQTLAGQAAAEEMLAKETLTKEALAKEILEKETLAEEDPAENEPGDELQIDPLVMEFLESDTYEAKLNILTALHPRITDDMINTLAVAVDIEINEGETEERFAQLKTCLLTFDKYERSRVR